MYRDVREVWESVWSECSECGKVCWGEGRGMGGVGEGALILLLAARTLHQQICFNSESPQSSVTEESRDGVCRKGSFDGTKTLVKCRVI